jgi:tripartite-type tricarboxylate transporter receptor subunit TctC
MMKTSNKTTLQLAAAVLLLASTHALPAFAQAWPNKPVKLVAVFPPGGSVDQVARILSVPLQKVLGQPVIVDNKGGASGSIGTAAVAKSDPDGYTFAVVFDTHGVNPSLIPNLSQERFSASHADLAFGDDGGGTSK